MAINNLMQQTNVLLSQLKLPMEDSDKQLQASVKVAKDTQGTITTLSNMMMQTNLDAEFLVYNIFSICKVLHPLGGGGCLNETANAIKAMEQMRRMYRMPPET